jgi:hypothetical protein
MGKGAYFIDMTMQPVLSYIYLLKSQAYSFHFIYLARIAIKK